MLARTKCSHPPSALPSPTERRRRLALSDRGFGAGPLAEQAGGRTPPPRLQMGAAASSPQSSSLPDFSRAHRPWGGVGGGRPSGVACRPTTWWCVLLALAVAISIRAKHRWSATHMPSHQFDASPPASQEPAGFLDMPPERRAAAKAHAALLAQTADRIARELPFV